MPDFDLVSAAMTLKSTQDMQAKEPQDVLICCAAKIARLRARTSTFAAIQNNWCAQL